MLPMVSGIMGAGGVLFIYSIKCSNAPNSFPPLLMIQFLIRNSMYSAREIQVAILMQTLMIAFPYLNTANYILYFGSVLFLYLDNLIEN